jgi:hypothetical protein
MTKRETASLLIKLMVVYAMLQFAPSLLFIVGQLSVARSGPTPTMALLITASILIAPLVWIGFCLIILRFSDRMAARLVQDDGEGGAILSLSFMDCQTLGYNFIGLLLIIQSFPQLIHLISALRFEGNIPELAQQTRLYRMILPKLLSFLAQFLLGIGLFLRARGLANLWEILQQKTRPMRKAPDNNQVDASSDSRDASV